MNQEIYDIDTLKKLVRRGKRQKYLFFWGHQPRKDGQIGKQCFSQWWSSPFTINNIRYPTTEHYMMAEKARLFNDEICHEKILSSPHPAAAKKIGRQIKQFDEEIWIQNRFEFVFQGNKAKFSQNSELKTFLLNTKTRILVESSPVDKIWGIGLSEDDPNVNNPLKWKGLNLLGFALMKVRDQIIDE